MLEMWPIGVQPIVQVLFQSNSNNDTMRFVKQSIEMTSICRKIYVAYIMWHRRKWMVHVMISLSMHHFKVFRLYGSNAVRCVSVTIFVTTE